MLSATSEEYENNSGQGQTSMLILLDLSAAATTDHGSFWHICSCLCKEFLSKNYIRLTCFLPPLWKDPDGSAWWPLTCLQGCLLLHGAKQLYFVTPPFQAQIAIARTAQPTLEIKTLPSLSGLSGFRHSGWLHQQKMRKLREVSTYCPQSCTRTRGDTTILQIHNTAKDCSLRTTLERHS